ncbi:hypothetical protein K466DRAFT_588527 [Polyporus arcularius HHB13444]|uniref:Uncharacterized protein n=1 Tax=Polyporus arcularius HHB13444 TaxID=1314778 RepID=A0A5C3P7K6_9APHY|nr:hypothetical protein K466DRAFT_588527 [Polyporus arcularius HHB13444]
MPLLAPSYEAVPGKMATVKRKSEGRSRGILFVFATTVIVISWLYEQLLTRRSGPYACRESRTQLLAARAAHRASSPLDV